MMATHQGTHSDLHSEQGALSLRTPGPREEGSAVTTSAPDRALTRAQLPDDLRALGPSCRGTLSLRLLRCQPPCGFDHRLDALYGAPAVAWNQRP